MPSEPQREGDDRQHRVHESSRRKSGRAGDVQILCPVHAAVPIGHAPSRIVVHARRARVMVRVRVETRIGVHSHDAHGFEIPAHERAQPLQSLMIVGASPPVQRGKRHAQRVASRAQRHPVFPMRRLLDVEHHAGPT